MKQCLYKFVNRIMNLDLILQFKIIPYRALQAISMNLLDLNNLLLRFCRGRKHITLLLLHLLTCNKTKSKHFPRILFGFGFLNE